MEDGNAAVERLYDTANAQGERERDPYLKDALNDVVDRVMSGDRFPKRGFPAIDLTDFLENHAQAHQLLSRILTTNGDEREVAIYEAARDVETLLRRHLEGSQIIHDRAEELSEEAREDAL